MPEYESKTKISWALCIPREPMKMTEAAQARDLITYFIMNQKGAEALNIETSGLDNSVRLRRFKTSDVQAK